MEVIVSTNTLHCVESLHFVDNFRSMWAQTASEKRQERRQEDT